MTKQVRPRIAVLMASFNRRDLTLGALRALHRSIAPEKAELDIFLVDDASTDGTSENVAKSWPSVHLISGTGNLFWSGGMRHAWLEAMKSEPDFYLWLNDDLALLPGALESVLNFWLARRLVDGERLIIVGKTLSPTSGKLTYGGYVRADGWSNLRFRRCREAFEPCDTMNGNCVLIPANAVESLGVIAPDYSHGYGDIDYGLRARRFGYKIQECPQPVGYQEENEAYQKNISRLDLSNWRFIFFHPKGVRLGEWYRFCRTHGGAIWPVNFFYRYLKMIFSFG